MQRGTGGGNDIECSQTLLPLRSDCMVESLHVQYGPLMIPKQNMMGSRICIHSLTESTNTKVALFQIMRITINLVVYDDLT